MGLISTSSKRAYAIPRSAAPRAPAHVSGHCWPVPPQETIKHSKAGLAQSLWDNMAEEKEVSSASPVRTPKLQLTAAQLLTGECWTPPRKDIPRWRAKGRPRKDGRRGEIAFRIIPHTCQRHSEGSNKTLCAPGDPTEENDYVPKLKRHWVKWIKSEHISTSS